ncbi:MAG: hypothetical protein GC160_05965 [Acidobacteria bacterium]|nr:hypothetical protein [Acidobacteriota bacterium]
MSKAKGLDLGTSRIVLATPNDDESFSYSAQLNAFVALPYSKVTERALQKKGVPHAVEGKEIIAYGDRAAEFANLLQGDTRRPMQTGLLNPQEPKSLEMIELALKRMVGPADKGDKICFSTPAAPPTNENDLIYHERTVRQMLEKLGYQVRSLNEGLAVVYAELEDDNFTGIGVSFGGGMCNVCVSYMGMPAISFSTVRAGDYIDRSASSVSGETPATVRLHKETGFALNGLSPNSVEQALSVYYNDVIETVVNGLATALASRGKLPKLERPATVVLAGGTALAGSFRNELDKALRKHSYPIDLGEVRLASDPLNTTAKGALMAAMLDM